MFLKSGSPSLLDTWPYARWLTLLKWYLKWSEVAQLCPTLWDPMDCSLPGSSVHGIFPGKNIGVGCHFLLQEIFPTQGLNQGLPHCRKMLYCLCHQGSPRKSKEDMFLRSGSPSFLDTWPYTRWLTLLRQYLHLESRHDFITYACMTWRVCSVMSDSVTQWMEPARLFCPWDFPGKSTGMGCRFWGSFWPRDWTLASCISCIGRQVLYQLSHWRSPFAYTMD